MWQHAVPATRFWQYAPLDRVAATENTEVRVVQDDRALYFGGHLPRRQSEGDHRPGHAARCAALQRRLRRDLPRHLPRSSELLLLLDQLAGHPPRRHRHRCAVVQHGVERHLAGQDAGDRRGLDRRVPDSLLDAAVRRRAADDVGTAAQSRHPAQAGVGLLGADPAVAGRPCDLAGRALRPVDRHPDRCRLRQMGSGALRAWRRRAQLPAGVIRSPVQCRRRHPLRLHAEPARHRLDPDRLRAGRSRSGGDQLHAISRCSFPSGETSSWRTPGCSPSASSRR